MSEIQVEVQNSFTNEDDEYVNKYGYIDVNRNSNVEIHRNEKNDNDDYYYAYTTK